MNCNHELKDLRYCSDDDYNIHTSRVENERREGMTLKYCIKCGAVFVEKGGAGNA